MKGRRKKQKNILLPAKLNDDQKASLHKYLDSIYYNTSAGGGYSTPDKLLKEVKRRGYYQKLGIQRIRNYLNKQSAYSLYKPAVTRFPTPPVKVSAMNEQFEMDLMDVSRHHSDNEGTKYLLTSIDVLSKFAYAIPLKSKESGEVTKAAAEIFDDRQPQVVETGMLFFIY